MAQIPVYSRSPISHRFSLIENGVEKFYEIEGTNRFEIKLLNEMVPKTNFLEESIFEAIKTKYKDHIKLFGGKTSDGLKYEPLIYSAKNDGDAKKIMADSRPVITDNEIAMKTKNIKKIG